MRYVFVLMILVLFKEISAARDADTCVTNEECSAELNKSYMCQNNVCVHEDIWPVTVRKSIGLLLSLIVSAFINAGGIGGSALIIPIYMKAFRFVIKEAVPLTKATIFGATFVSFCVNIFKRQARDPSQPLIDHQVTAYVLGLALAGTSVGVILMRVLPAEVILIWMVGYMFYFSHYVTRRAWTYHQRESLELLREKAAADLLRTQGGTGEGSEQPMRVKSSETVLQQSDTVTEPKQIGFFAMLRPHIKFIVLSFLSFVIILTASMLQGGRGMKSVIGIEDGSLGWFGIFFAGQCANIGLSLSLGFGVNKKFRQMRQARDVIIETEAGKAESVEAGTSAGTVGEVLSRSFQIFCGGIVSGSVGVGGGIVVSLFLLDSGYSPQRSAAICATVTMYTTLSTALQFLVGGFFSLKNAFILSAFTMLGSYLGNVLIDRLIKRYRRQAILLWIIAAVTITSTLVMSALGFSQLTERNAVLEFGGSYAPQP